MLGKVRGENYSEQFTASSIKFNKAGPMKDSSLMLLLHFEEVNTARKYQGNNYNNYLGICSARVNHSPTSCCTISFPISSQLYIINTVTIDFFDCLPSPFITTPFFHCTSPSAGEFNHCLNSVIVSQSYHHPQGAHCFVIKSTHLSPAFDYTAGP